MVLVSLAAIDAVRPPLGTAHIVSSIIKDHANLLERHDGRRRLYESGLSSGFVRKLASKSQQANCDASFLGCLPNAKCIDCFATLELERIDWTGVTPDTQCSDVVSFLNDGGHCTKLAGDQGAIAAFCDTFDACVVWSEDDNDNNSPSDEEGFVNCTALTECKWDGMKENWIGDGICHDNMHGCYNTAICNYDGGDCCEDTCQDKGSEYKQCGQDGYTCRNPDSENCDSFYTSKCKTNGNDEKKRADEVTCQDSEQKYRLIMYDSFGDGWDKTTVTLRKSGTTKKIFEGSLQDGSEGTEYICLSKEPACYNAVTNGGTWGVEVSWEIKTMKEGSPAIVGSGAPSDCDFPVAGGDCEKTCEGKPTTNPTDDPDYKSFKELSNCIAEKCIIQLGACRADSVCEQCFVEDAPDYCYGVDSFNAVLECTLCSCTDRADKDVCTKKDGPGSMLPPSDNRDDENSSPKKCSGAETMKGAKAVMDFSECAKMDDIGVMVIDFDQSNFGQLDQFETCAHEYTQQSNHGGHTALGCMQVLFNAMTNPVAPENDKNPPLEAISALAKDLYQNAEKFCDCAKKSSDDCPLCPSFMSFKTLLYESLDACSALDEIDCDAWGEFWKPCKNNLEGEYGKSDLKTRDQCDYMKKGCGGAGAFPAFRRLDCDEEVSSEAWEFYRKYEKSCLKGDDGVPPDDSPVPRPTSPPASSPTKPPVTPPSPSKDPANAPTLVPYIPSDDDVTPKPYVPSGAKGDAAKSKSHWFRNLVILGILGGGGYYLYKRRYHDNYFNFMQYRRVRNYGYEMDSSDGGGMYSNLNSSTSFEPATLPPTPMMMDGSYDNGGGIMGGQMMQSFSGNQMS